MDEVMIETGVNLPPDSDLTSLHWFNIPGTPTKENTVNNEFLLSLQKLIGASTDTPLFIYVNNSFIIEFETLKHSKDDVDIMNYRGVHIYLYEPICPYVVGSGQRKDNPQQQGSQFYIDLPAEIDPHTIRAVELDAIKIYADNNQLTNITVHSCDYNIETYYPFYSQLTMLCDDLFLRNQTVYDTVQQSMSPDFTRKFICTNWRYTKTRNLIAAYLYSHSAHLSWSYSVSLSTLQNKLWFNLDEWKEHYPDQYEIITKNLAQLESTAPIVLDIKPESAAVIQHTGSYCYPLPDYYMPDNKFKNSLEMYYRDSFVSVVTESRFAQMTSNYSEKMYQAALHRKPFIMVAPPKTIEYIKTEGFRTFDEFWDESYDDCLNHQTRLIKIYEVIEFINRKSLVELRQMYMRMSHIMEHNYHTMVNKTPDKHIFKIAGGHH